MSQDLIALALKLLSCTQKELSTILNVSPTQISKWKKGEYMSFESSDKLKKILMIGDLDPGTILITGSIKNAEKWEKLITFIAELAEKQVETGYRTAPLIDETDLLTSTILHLLQEIGIQIPETFFLLGIIYNTSLHLAEGNDISIPLGLKLENLTIKRMIKNIFFQK